MSFVIDPDAVLDFQFDWSEWLSDGEIITAHTVTTGDTITVDSSTHTDTTVTAWVSGGSDKSSATLTCHVLTTAGRQDDRSIRLLIRQR